MICFHSLNYWYLHQLPTANKSFRLRCDLLSFFELLIFTPTGTVLGDNQKLLWFAFILWTTDIYTNFTRHWVYNITLWFAFILWTTDIYTNKMARITIKAPVVICFHSLNYWYLHQPWSSRCRLALGCDLLSFFELLIFTPTNNQNFLLTVGCDLLSFFELLIFTPTRDTILLAVHQLWFAFILWTTDIYTNCLAKNKAIASVVICFHSLNYWYLHQQSGLIYSAETSCDLLSFFELLIFTPTQFNHRAFVAVLWFAFILWTTDIYTNVVSTNLITIFVVICFHSLNYWYLHQHPLTTALNWPCCDLLSFFELLIFTPTSK